LFPLLVVGAGEALLNGRLAVRRVGAGKHLDADVAAATGTVAPVSLLAQVPAFPAWRGRRKGPKRLRRRLTPVGTDRADLRRHPLVRNVHPGIGAVKDAGLGGELAARMAGGKHRRKEKVVGCPLLEVGSPSATFAKAQRSGRTELREPSTDSTDGTDYVSKSVKSVPSVDTPVLRRFHLAPVLCFV